MYDNNNTKKKNIENEENKTLLSKEMMMMQMQQNMMINGSLDASSYNNMVGGGGGGDGSTAAAAFPDLLLPPQWNHPAYHLNQSFNPAREPDPFLPQTLFRQFGYDLIAADSSAPFGLHHAELQKMTAQEIMDAKALAASKSHSEAERRRRERINNHLARLRSLLPSTTKTDKASLLAEVIEHVKELKRQTTLIAETSPVPTETDELTIDTSSEFDDEDGKPIIRASICCEDRPDLMPDLIRTLKDLRLKTLKAEITTLGGRVKNVLFITTEDDDNEDQISISSIEEALRAVMEKSNGDHDQSASAGGASVKRQRTNEHNNTRSL